MAEIEIETGTTAQIVEELRDQTLDKLLEGHIEGDKTSARVYPQSLLELSDGYYREQKYLFAHAVYVISLPIARRLMSFVGWENSSPSDLHDFCAKRIEAYNRIPPYDPADDADLQAEALAGVAIAFIQRYLQDDIFEPEYLRTVNMSDRISASIKVDFSRITRDLS